MRVAPIQFEPGSDPGENVERVLDRVHAAADEGADLVVLPEIWNVGYFNFEGYREAAEPVDGPTTTRLREVAAERDIYLHTGSIVERDGEDLYNTSGLVSPDGDLLDTYRKLHLFGYESEESGLLTPGERVVAVDTAFGTMGLTTCYDLRFPELYRALVDRGVEFLLVTSAWPAARLEHWQLLNRTRALEAQAFVVAANLCGEHAGVRLAGRSLVVDPWGIPLTDAGEGERTVTADVDATEVRDVREEFPALADRRGDLEVSF